MFQKESIQAAFDRYVTSSTGPCSGDRHEAAPFPHREPLVRETGRAIEVERAGCPAGLGHGAAPRHRPVRNRARRYHTFIDYKSMDHARYGVVYLFEYRHIRDFVPASTDDEVLEQAILFHSAYEIPASVTGRSRIFCELLRMRTRSTCSGCTPGTWRIRNRVAGVPGGSGDSGIEPGRVPGGPGRQTGPYPEKTHGPGLFSQAACARSSI